MAFNHAKATPRRVDWTAADDVTAMTMAALGIATARIANKTGLTPCQVAYRMRRAGIKLGHYRNAEPGTLGGQVASKLVRDIVDEYRPLVESRLAKALPTKAQARAGAKL